jgi:photosystem II stability/assembly factor-like uncharacterized protein
MASRRDPVCPFALVTAALALALLSSGSTPSRAADWSLVPAGTNQDLLGIQEGWPDPHLVGRLGYIALPDAGHTAWTPFSVSTSEDLRSVLSQSVGQVWVAGGGGVVRLFLGGTWNTNRDLPAASESFVLFSDASMTSFAAGSAGSLFYSGDAGATWQGQASGTTVTFHDGLMGWPWGWAVGDHGTIVRTSNVGATWVSQPTGTTEDLFAITRTGSTYLVVGANGTILRSTDLGVTWSPISCPTRATLRDVSVSKQNGAILYAVGSGGTVIRSGDSGLTWCLLETASSARLNAVTALNNFEILAAGDGGVLLRTLTGGGSCATLGVGPGAEAGPESCRYLGPSPSPLVGRGQFAFTPARSGMAEASLHDVSGRRLATCFRGYALAGQTRIVELDANVLAPGVYFLRLRGEGFDLGRRVVVAR